MSNSDISPAAPIGEGNPLHIKLLWCPRAGRFLQTGSPAGRCNHPLSRSYQTSVPSGFLVRRPGLWAGDCAPPSHFKHLQHIVWCCHVICQTLLKTTFYAHRFFFYSVTASDGATTGRVASPCSITVHHGYISKEVMCARRENIDYPKQHHTPHCWLPPR